MYAKISNGAVDQYPYTVGDLRRDNPNTSFPKRPSDETLASWGVYSVTQLPEPNDDPDANHINPNDMPHLQDGAWVLGWTVVPKTAEEIQAATDSEADRNREIRNALLAETDYHGLSDVTMSSEITTYRQALRDITSHANWPYLDASDWPVKP
jgi:hypothetical protein